MANFEVEVRDLLLKLFPQITQLRGVLWEAPVKARRIDGHFPSAGDVQGQSDFLCHPENREKAHRSRSRTLSGCVTGALWESPERRNILQKVSEAQSLHHHAFAIVQQLSAEGMLAADFFDDLIRHRPKQRPAIEAIARMLPTSSTARHTIAVISNTAMAAARDQVVTALSR